MLLLPAGSGVAVGTLGVQLTVAPMGSNGSVTATITSGSSTSDPNAANSVLPATTSVVAAGVVPVPVNAWWSLIALMTLVLGSAAVADRRRR